VNGSRLNLPNLITVARIAVCPVIFWLTISPGAGARFAAFGLFVTAALSDVWDGYLARRYDLITDMGKLLDPIADKLLLVVTLVPLYMISHGENGPPVPWWGPLPTWVLVVIFGREALMTVFRTYAARRGVVIAAGASGKRKAMFQMSFIGGLLLWYPLSELAAGLQAHPPIGARDHGDGWSVGDLLGSDPGLGRDHARRRARSHGILDDRLPLVVPSGGRDGGLIR